MYTYTRRTHLLWIMDVLKLVSLRISPLHRGLGINECVNAHCIARIIARYEVTRERKGHQRHKKRVSSTKILYSSIYEHNKPIYNVLDVDVRYLPI